MLNIISTEIAKNFLPSNQITSLIMLLTLCQACQVESSRRLDCPIYLTLSQQVDRLSCLIKIWASRRPVTNKYYYYYYFRAEFYFGRHELVFKGNIFCVILQYREIVIILLFIFNSGQFFKILFIESNLFIIFIFLTRNTTKNYNISELIILKKIRIVDFKLKKLYKILTKLMINKL